MSGCEGQDGTQRKAKRKKRRTLRAGQRGRQWERPPCFLIGGNYGGSMAAVIALFPRKHRCDHLPYLVLGDVCLAVRQEEGLPGGDEQIDAVLHPVGGMSVLPADAVLRVTV